VDCVARRHIGASTHSRRGKPAGPWGHLPDAPVAQAREHRAMHTTVSALPRFGPVARRIVVGAAAVNSIGAVLGGAAPLHDAGGMGYKESWLSGPFSNYTLPGLFLLLVIGGGMIVVAALALAEGPAAPGVSYFMGSVLLAWLVIETLVIGYRGPVQIGFLIACGCSGLALAWLGRRALTRS
jgi:hypothetical protein